MLYGQVLVAGQATGVASVRSSQKLPPCLSKPIPASSKMNLMLAKAESISNDGSAPGITDLRGKGAAPYQPERRVSECERICVCRHQNQWRRRGGGGPGTGTKIPLLPMG